MILTRDGILGGRGWAEAPSQDTFEHGLRNGLVALTLLLVGVAVAQLAFYLWVAPRLLVRTVEILGWDRDRSSLIQSLGLDRPRPFHLLDEEAIRTALLSLPEVRSVTVTKRFPDRLVISLDQRKPVALMVHPRSPRVFLVDREGVIFAKERVSGLDLPLLAGFEWDDQAAQPRLPDTYQDFLDDLFRLMVDNRSLYELISEIRIHPYSPSGFYLTLRFVHSPVKVLLEQHFGAREVKQALLFLDLLKRELDETALQELDMRGGTAVVRRRGPP